MPRVWTGRENIRAITKEARTAVAFYFSFLYSHFSCHFCAILVLKEIRMRPLFSSSNSKEQL